MTVQGVTPDALLSQNALGLCEGGSPPMFLTLKDDGVGVDEGDLGMGFEEKDAFFEISGVEDATEVEKAEILSLGLGKGLVVTRSLVLGLGWGYEANFRGSLG